VISRNLPLRSSAVQDCPASVSVAQVGVAATPFAAAVAVPVAGLASTRVPLTWRPTWLPSLAGSMLKSVMEKP